MWSRVELKTRAKVVLKKYYWKMFAVSMLLLFIGGRDGGGGSNNNQNQQDAIKLLPEEIAYWILKYMLIIGSIFFVLWALRVFIGYALEIGCRKFYVRTAEDNCDMGYIGYYFKGGRYLGVVGTMFLRSIYLILWTLLFIIPGIIKSYAYRMVPYILADNPDIGSKRAIELSNQMTAGHKWDMFVLDLSFIGWYLLGLLALGIGVLFVMPYEDATKAELYLLFREHAVERGWTSLTELNLVEAYDYE